MLSYQHAYHAGNFADVHKHLTLFAVLRYLLRKESAITYVDTHAGRGLYPLSATESQRLQEHRRGVEPVWQHRDGFGQALLFEWCQALGDTQPDKTLLSHYPGSPWWLGRALREQDALRLYELHPGEHRHLSEQPLANNAARIFGDGLEGLKKQLPVTSPRLCVLIDPSFERKEEYQDVADTVRFTLAKARHAVLLVWYPLLPAAHHTALVNNLAASGIGKIWRSELFARTPGSTTHGMYGSGMLVINPPWGIDETLSTAFDEIAPLLGERCYHRASWLAGE
ncbi:MAG: 23S rRNA (adenine(2030)-N(6))-methyltransferase RlmJ [Halomonas subglaciescola]|nr:23S rRNA (adenine(2030)-N(6))-methyltransferase RlmJ [Halomonas subglaciescola]